MIGCVNDRYKGPPLPNPWATRQYGQATPGPEEEPDHLADECPGLLKWVPGLPVSFCNERFRNTPVFDPEGKLPSNNVDDNCPDILKWLCGAPEGPHKKPEWDPQSGDPRKKKSSVDGNFFADVGEGSEEPFDVSTLTGSESLWGDSASAGSWETRPSLGNDPSLVASVGPDLGEFNSAGGAFDIASAGGGLSVFMNDGGNFDVATTGETNLSPDGDLSALYDGTANGDLWALNDVTPDGELGEFGEVTADRQLWALDYEGTSGDISATTLGGGDEHLFTVGGGDEDLFATTLGGGDEDLFATTLGGDEDLFAGFSRRSPRDFRF